jgi:type I restriction enzyme, S subunit
VRTPPEKWTTTTIGAVAEPVSKIRPSAEPDKEFTYVDISSITGQVIANPKRMLGKMAPSRARQAVRTGDVLLSTVRTYLKHVALVTEDLDGAVASTGFCVIRPTSELNPKYLLFYMLDQRFVDALSARQTGSAYPAVRDSDVKALAIAFPSLHEQERIVLTIEERFSHVSAAEAPLRSVPVRLSLLRDGLRDVAGAWPTVSLGELLAEPLMNGRSVRTRAGGFPVLRLSAITGGRVNLIDRKGGDWDREHGLRFRVTQGDFLVARGSGSLALVGRGGLVIEEPDEVAFPDTIIRVRCARDRMNPRYLRVVWHSKSVRKQIEKTARTTAGIYKVNQADLQGIQLPCPPLQVQDELADEFEATDSTIEALHASCTRAQQRSTNLRQAILRDAFDSHMIVGKAGAES